MYTAATSTSRFSFVFALAKLNLKHGDDVLFDLQQQLLPDDE
jgi:hypothetical protein